MKRILMIVASSEFRDIEYIVPRAFFEQAGVEVKTASSTDDSIGRFGYKIAHEFLIKDVDQSQFDALFFVGGKGALQFLEDDLVKSLTLQFIEANKPIGAICAAPRNFLHWGIMKDKAATGHNWDNNFATLCEEAGAIDKSSAAVVIAGKILTANGPEASEEAALKFLALINL